jgi:tetratricopeptide (TPR) repeat protein
VAALIGYGIEALFQNAGHSGKKIIAALLAATLVFYAAAGFKLSAPWVSILGIIRQGVSESPGRYEARHDLGYFLNSKEKYRAALPQLETALRIGAPTSIQTAQTLNLLGKALFNLDDYYGAVLCFNKAMEIDPSHEDPYIKAVMREAMEKAASIQNGNIEDQPK